jgi:hypothetical protein
MHFNVILFQPKMLHLIKYRLSSVPFIWKRMDENDRGILAIRSIISSLILSRALVIIDGVWIGEGIY